MLLQHATRWGQGKLLYPSLLEFVLHKITSSYQDLWSQQNMTNSPRRHIIVCQREELKTLWSLGMLPWFITTMSEINACTIVCCKPIISCVDLLEPRTDSFYKFDNAQVVGFVLCVVADKYFPNPLPDPSDNQIVDIFQYFSFRSGITFGLNRRGLFEWIRVYLIDIGRMSLLEKSPDALLIQYTILLTPNNTGRCMRNNMILIPLALSTSC